ncbi:MAG: DUF6252 family protein [Psychroserpens sp.]
MTISVLLASCGGDDDSPSSQGGTDSFFAKIDGADYNPPSISGFRFESTNSIILTGATGTTEEQIQIFVPDDIAVGTYTSYYDPLNSPFIQAYYQPAGAQDADDTGIADTGSLVITQHDIDAKTIKGTFNFNTEPALSSGTAWTITEGSFEITYSDLD